MIVLDTSGVLAALDDSGRMHTAARAALESDEGPLLLSPFVLQEIDYLLGRKNVDAELLFLREVAGGVYQIEPLSGEEIGLAADVVERYRDMEVGLADASVIVIAARAGTTRILSLDERHFRAMRPLRGRAFTLLPADA